MTNEQYGLDLQLNNYSKFIGQIDTVQDKIEMISGSLEKTAQSFSKLKFDNIKFDVSGLKALEKLNLAGKGGPIGTIAKNMTELGKAQATVDNEKLLGFFKAISGGAQAKTISAKAEALGKLHAPLENIANIQISNSVKQISDLFQGLSSAASKLDPKKIEEVSKSISSLLTRVNRLNTVTISDASIKGLDELGNALDRIAKRSNVSEDLVKISQGISKLLNSLNKLSKGNISALPPVIDNVGKAFEQLSKSLANFKVGEGFDKEIVPIINGLKDFAQALTGLANRKSFSQLPERFDQINTALGKLDIRQLKLLAAELEKLGPSFQALGQVIGNAPKVYKAQGAATKQLTASKIQLTAAVLNVIPAFTKFFAMLARPVFNLFKQGLMATIGALKQLSVAFLKLPFQIVSKSLNTIKTIFLTFPISTLVNGIKLLGESFRNLGKIIVSPFKGLVKLGQIVRDFTKELRLAKVGLDVIFAPFKLLLGVVNKLVTALGKLVTALNPFSRSTKQAAKNQKDLTSAIQETGKSIQQSNQQVVTYNNNVQNTGRVSRIASGGLQAFGTALAARGVALAVTRLVNMQIAFRALDKLAMAAGAAFRTFSRIVSSFVSEGFDAARALEDVSRSMNILTAGDLMRRTPDLGLKEAVEATKGATDELITRFQEFAFQSPFSRDDLLAGQKLAQSLGFTSERAEQLVNLTADWAAANGLAGHAISSILLPLGQMNSLTKANTVDIKQLITAGNIPAFELLRKHLEDTSGEMVSMIDVQDLLAAGQIDADTAINAIIKGFMQFQGSSKTATESLSGLTNTFVDFKNNLLRGFLTPLLSAENGLRGLAVQLLNVESIRFYVAEAEKLGLVFAQHVVNGVNQAVTVFQTIQAIIQNIPQPVIEVMKTMGKFVGILAGVSVALGVLKIAFIAVGAVMFLFLNPINLIIGAIIGLTTIVVQNADTIRNAFANAFTFIGNLPMTMGAFAVDVINQIDTVIGGFGELGNSIAEFASNSLNTIGSFSSTLIQGFADTLSNVAEFGSALVSAFADGIISTVNIVADALASVGEMITYWLAPGSPPRLLPDIDDWGTAVAEEYLKGFTDADIKLINQFGSDIQTVLEGLDIENINVEEVARGFATGLNNLNVEGDFGADAMAHIVELTASAGPEIQSLISKYTILAEEQSKLNQTTALYNEEISKAQGLLDSLGAQDAIEQNQSKIERLQEALKTTNLTQQEETNIQRQIEKLQAENRIKQLEDQKKQQEESVKAVESSIDKQKDLLDLSDKFDGSGKTGLAGVNSAVASTAKTAKGRLDAMAKALLDNQLAGKSTAEQIAILRKHLSTLEEGSLEYVQTLTKIEKLEAKLAKGEGSLGKRAELLNRFGDSLGQAPIAIIQATENIQEQTAKVTTALTNTQRKVMEGMNRIRVAFIIGRDFDLDIPVNFDGIENSILTITSMVGRVVRTFSQWRTSVSEFLTANTQVVAGLKVLAGILVSAGIAAGIAAIAGSLAVLLNPITLAVGAIGALAVSFGMLVRSSGGIGEAFTTIQNSITEFASGFVISGEGITNFFNNISTSLVDAGLKESIVDIFDNIGESIATFVDSLSISGQSILDVFNNIITNIGNIFSGMSSTDSEQMELLPDELFNNETDISIFGNIASMIQTVLSNAQTSISNAFSRFSNFIITNWQTIVSNTVQLLVLAFAGSWITLSKLIGNILSGITIDISGFTGAAGNILTAIIDNIIIPVADAFSNGETFLGKIARGLLAFYSGLANLLIFGVTDNLNTETGQKIIDKINSFFTDNAFGKILEDNLNEVFQIILPEFDLSNSLTGLVTSIEGISNTITTLFDNISSAFSGEGDGVLANIINANKDAFNEFLTEISSPEFQAALKTIGEVLGVVAGAITAVAAAIIDVALISILRNFADIVIVLGDSLGRMRDGFNDILQGNILSGFGEIFGGIIDLLSGITDELGDIVGDALTTLVSFFNPELATRIDPIVQAISDLVATFFTGRLAIRVFQRVWMSLSKAFITAKKNFDTVQTFFKTFFTFLKTQPTLAFGGIFGLFTLIDNAIDTFLSKDYVQSFTEWATGWAQGMIDGLLTFVTNFPTMVAEFFTGIFEEWFKPASPPKFLPDIIEWGKEIALLLISGLLTAPLTGLLTFGTMFKDELKAGIDTIVAIALSVKDFFTFDMSFSFADIGTNITNALNTAIDSIINVSVNIADFFTFDTTFSLTDIGTNLSMAFTSAIDTIVDIAVNVADFFAFDTTFSLTDLGTNLSTAFTDAIDTITNITVSVADFFTFDKSFDLKDLGKTLGDTFSEAVDKITAITVNIADFITIDADEENKLATTISNALPNVDTLFGEGSTNKIAITLADIFTINETEFNNVSTSLTNFVESLSSLTNLSAIPDAFTNSVQSIFDLFTGESTLSETIGNITDSLLSVVNIAAIPQIFIDGLNTILGLFVDNANIETIITGVIDGLGSLATLAGIPSAVVESISDIFSFISGDSVDVTQASAISDALASFGELTGIPESVRQSLESITEFFTSNTTIGATVDAIATAFERFDNITGIGTGFTESLQAIIDLLTGNTTLVDTIQTLATAFSGIATALGTSFGNPFAELDFTSIEGIVNTLNENLTSIIESFESLTTFDFSGISEAFDPIVSAFTDIKEQVEGALSVLNIVPGINIGGVENEEEVGQEIAEAMGAQDVEIDTNLTITTDPTQLSNEASEVLGAINTAIADNTTIFGVDFGEVINDFVAAGFDSTDLALLGEEAGVEIPAGLEEGLSKPENWLGVQTAAGSEVENLITSIKESLGIESPSTVFRDEIGGEMIAGIEEAFTQENESLTTAVGTLFQRILTTAQTQLTLVAQSLNIAQELFTLDEVLVQTTVTSLNLLSETFSNTFSDITELVEETLGEWFELFEEFFLDTLELAEEFAIEFVNIFEDLGDRVESAVRGIAARVAALTDEFRNAGIELARALRDGIVETLEGNALIDRVAAAARRIADSIAADATVIQAFFTAGESFGTPFVNGIAAGIDGQTTSNTLRQAVEALVDRIINIAQQAAGIASPSKVAAALVGVPIGEGVIVGLEAGVSNLSSNVENAINSVMAVAQNGVGNQFSTGIAQGIASGTSAVINAAALVANSAVTSAQTALDIHSPSRVSYNTIGVPFVQGVTNALADGSSVVSSMANNFMNILPNHANFDYNVDSIGSLTPIQQIELQYNGLMSTLPELQQQVMFNHNRGINLLPTNVNVSDMLASGSVVNNINRVYNDIATTNANSVNTFNPATSQHSLSFTQVANNNDMRIARATEAYVIPQIVQKDAAMAMTSSMYNNRSTIVNQQHTEYHMHLTTTENKAARQVKRNFNNMRAKVVFNNGSS